MTTNVRGWSFGFATGTSSTYTAGWFSCSPTALTIAPGGSASVVGEASMM
jgi:hypothetical protein